MTIDLTQIIQAIIALIAALISYRLIPWIQARTSNEQQMRLEAAINIAVFAAEQIFGAGRGAEKMDYAIQYLRDKGFEVDSREIEAEVQKWFAHEDKPPEEDEDTE